MGDALIPLQVAADRCGISAKEALWRIGKRGLPFLVRAPIGTLNIDHQEERSLFIEGLAGGQSVKLGLLRSRKFDTPDYISIDNVFIREADITQLGSNWPIDFQKEDELLSGTRQITDEFNLLAIARGKVKRPLSWSTIQKRHYREIFPLGLKLSYPKTGKRIPSILKSDLKAYIESL